MPKNVLTPTRNTLTTVSSTRNCKAVLSVDQMSLRLPKKLPTAVRTG